MHSHLTFFLLSLYAPGRCSRSQSSGHPFPDPGWMTERKGTGERYSFIAPTFLGLTPGWAERLAAAWLGEAGRRHHTSITQAFPGCPQNVLSIARMLLGLLLGTTEAYPDCHWGFIRASHRGNSEASPGAGHTWQVGVTLFSLQGLSSEQQVRVGCFGPSCA